MLELQVWNLVDVPAYLQVHHLMGPLQQALEAHFQLYASQMLLRDVFVKDGDRPIRLGVLEVELGWQNSPGLLLNILQSDCRDYNV